jgi:hypothetical protein
VEALEQPRLRKAMANRLSRGKLFGTLAHMPSLDLNRNVAVFGAPQQWL